MKFPIYLGILIPTHSPLSSQIGKKIDLKI